MTSCTLSEELGSNPLQGTNLSINIKQERIDVDELDSRSDLLVNPRASNSPTSSTNLGHNSRLSLYPSQQADSQTKENNRKFSHLFYSVLKYFFWGF